MSTYTSVVISPETTTSPVFTSVSQATRPSGSSAITASRTPSEIWSAILSGWPSVTDSEVNRNSLSESCCVVMGRGRVAAGALVPAVPATSAQRLATCFEVDHQRDPLHSVAVPQPVLEEVGVVTGHQGAVRDLQREARRLGLELGQVVEPQPPAAHGGRLAEGLEVGEEAVELGGRDAAARAVGHVERRRDEAAQGAAGLGRHRQHLWALA